MAQLLKSTDTCNGNDCPEHFHTENSIFLDNGTHQQSQIGLLDQRRTNSEGNMTETTVNYDKGSVDTKAKTIEPAYDPNDRGFRRIIRNFTPS